jgi:hypothetical protein
MPPIFPYLPRYSPPPIIVEPKKGHPILLSLVWCRYDACRRGGMFASASLARRGHGLGDEAQAGRSPRSACLQCPCHMNSTYCRRCLRGGRSSISLIECAGPAGGSTWRSVSDGRPKRVPHGKNERLQNDELCLSGDRRKSGEPSLGVGPVLRDGQQPSGGR